MTNLNFWIPFDPITYLYFCPYPHPDSHIFVLVSTCTEKACQDPRHGSAEDGKPYNLFPCIFVSNMLSEELDPRSWSIFMPWLYTKRAGKFIGTERIASQSRPRGKHDCTPWEHTAPSLLSHAPPCTNVSHWQPPMLDRKYTPPFLVLSTKNLQGLPNIRFLSQDW